MNEGPVLKCKGCKYFKENKCEKLEVDIIDCNANHMCPFMLNSIKKINDFCLENFKNFLNNKNIKFYKCSFDRYSDYLIYKIQLEYITDNVLTQIKSILPKSTICISGIGYNFIEISIVMMKEIKNYE